MPINLMNHEHITTNQAYRDNYDRIFQKKERIVRNCPYLCDFGERDGNVYCQVVHSYVKECHPACVENEERN
jgi:hypothetical protein